MKSAILVNGIPASGKSTVARAVAALCGCPLLTLDTIKDPFFEHLGIGDRDYNRTLGRASYQAIFGLVRDWPAPVTVAVDAWFGFQPRAVLESHLATAGIGRTVEIWCHAPAEVLAARYRARLGSRSAGHPGESYVPELVALAGRAAPLGRGPLFEVDTTAPLPREALAAFLAGHLGFEGHR